MARGLNRVRPVLEHRECLSPANYHRISVLFFDRQLSIWPSVGGQLAPKAAIGGFGQPQNLAIGAELKSK